MLIKSRPKYITLTILGVMMALLIVGLMYSEKPASATIPPPVDANGSEMTLDVAADVAPAADILVSATQLADVDIGMRPAKAVSNLDGSQFGELPLTPGLVGSGITSFNRQLFDTLTVTVPDRDVGSDGITFAYGTLTTDQASANGSGGDITIIFIAVADQDAVNTGTLRSITDDAITDNVGYWLSTISGAPFTDDPGGGIFSVSMSDQDGILWRTNYGHSTIGGSPFADDSGGRSTSSVSISDQLNGLGTNGTNQQLTRNGTFGGTITVATTKNTTYWSSTTALPSSAGGGDITVTFRLRSPDHGAFPTYDHNSLVDRSANPVWAKSGQLYSTGTNLSGSSGGIIATMSLM